MFKIFIKNVIGLGEFAISFFVRSKKTSILMYHSVSKNKEFFCVAPANFERHLKFLKKRKFNVIKLDSLVKIIQTKNEPNFRTMALTFDDGYQDNYLIAFPLLKKYNLPATILLVTDLVGKEGYLSWGEIKEMRQSGLVEFGCHTVSHPDLTKISKEELGWEIQESKKIIEEKLRTPCEYFAYPYGYFDDFVAEEVKKARFKVALTIKKEMVSAQSDVFELPRLSIDSSTTFPQFLGKISGLQFVKNKT